MIDWSAELGSDITFFLSRGTAYCTGRGEIMSPIDPPLERSTKVCIVKPNIGLSTPSVFRALDYRKLSTIDPDNVLLPTFLKGIFQVPTEMFVNDLEDPAFRCIPELLSLKSELLQVEGFDRVLMSGSGTSIFCLGEPLDRFEFENKFSVREDIQKVHFTTFVNRMEGEWFQQP